MYQSSDGAHVFDIQIDATDASSHHAGTEPSILFPDKDALFTADFRRSGIDLLIVGTETKAIVLGYFRDDRRLNIVTPEGASLRGETVEILAGPDPPTRYVQATDTASAQPPIGRVEKVTGSVTILRNGALVELRLGDTVARGDVVQTGPDSSLTIKLNDGTVFNLSASARMVLNDMVYAAGSNANSAFITLVQGLIGFVAGQVAKTGDLKVDTPVATMAIRGTAVQTEIVAISGTTKFSLLTEPDGRVGSILLLDKSNHSRVLASMSDARISNLLIPVPGVDPQITQITKTIDEIRGESDFVRDLFQFVSSEPRQRRGSSDTEDAAIIPASYTPSVDAPDQSQSIFVPFTQERIAPREQAVPDPVITSPPIRGTAVEDGPVARLAALSPSIASDTETQPRVLAPESLPPGVRYLESTQSFVLDPTHPAYQHLGKGEVENVRVKYRLILDDGSIVPTSVTWTVNGRNDAPLARDDRIPAVEETGRTVLAVLSNDRDIDGDSLRAVSWTSLIEGSVRLDAKGNLVFDPGEGFRALSGGQTATISFSYRMSDGKGGEDTANVTLQIQGKGVFSSPVQSASDTETLDFNGQPVSLTIKSPTATTTNSADLDLTIALGPVLQPQINILYLIDVSGSTSEGFDGVSVDDLNKDGRANTILDAEIASLEALTEKVRALGFSPADVTVTIIPFNESADPTDERDPDLSGLNAATFSLGRFGDGAIQNYLRGLDTGGETNFADALRAANDRLSNLDQGGEKNVLYFLSDGRGQGAIGAEIITLNEHYNATIEAIGVGGDASLSQLNQIDNTDGAMLLTSPVQIDASIVGLPIFGGIVSDIDIYVNGTEIAGIGPEDLIVSGNKLTLDMSLNDLRRLAGDRNDVSAAITFQSGEVLTAKLNIAGALPRSTDMIL